MKNSKNMSLTFKELHKTNYARCRKWHKSKDLSDWSISDWAVAAAGEMGEVCNAVKKLNRLRDKLPSKNDLHRQIDTKEMALYHIEQEIADTILYLDLLATRLGINLEEAIKMKFNLISERYGFKHKL